MLLERKRELTKNWKVWEWQRKLVMLKKLLKYQRRKRNLLKNQNQAQQRRKTLKLKKHLKEERVRNNPRKKNLKRKKNLRRKMLEGPRSLKKVERKAESDILMIAFNNLY